MFSFRLHKPPRYLEWKSHPKRSVIVAGVGRSGTTWLGDVVSHMINGRVVFEPCLIGKDGRFLMDHTGKVNLDNKSEQPIRLWNKVNFDNEILDIERMLFGNIQGDWVDQDVGSGIYSKRVIKMIRANLFIGHIAHQWQETKIVYIIRSPNKVVESMMAQEMQGWNFNWSSEHISSCAEALSDWDVLVENLDWDKDSLIDRLTLRWCIEMKVALGQLHDAKNCILLQYESLVRGNNWGDLSLFLQDRGCKGLPTEQLLKKPSRTESGINVVRLNATQIERIHKMSDVFGLSQWIQ